MIIMSSHANVCNGTINFVWDETGISIDFELWLKNGYWHKVLGPFQKRLINPWSRSPLTPKSIIGSDYNFAQVSTPEMWHNQINSLKIRSSKFSQNLGREIFDRKLVSAVFISLVPGRSYCNRKLVIFKLISRIGILSISYESALRWMPQDLTDDWSTVVMAWCRQACANVDPILP